MDRETLARLEPALEPFLECFAGCAVAPTRRLIATYVRGQLSGLPRKSVKPMALQAGIPPRTLQELLSLHRWDEDLLLALLQRRVRRIRSPGPAFGLLFETRCVKKGDRTPGVARQTCESSGRQRNCVVLLHLGFSDGEVHCLLDSAVYLPESWTDDVARRRGAGVPEEVRYRSKAAIVGDLLKRAEANGIDLARVVSPPEYLADPALAETLRAAGKATSSWPAARAPAPVAGPSAPENMNSLLLRPALEARGVIEARMGEIGLSHFEVRTYRSLVRHLALSAASLLFIAESHTSPREPFSLARRSRA